MLKSLFPWKRNKTKQVMAARPAMDDELIIQEHSLLPCNVCGRTFLPNPLKKHEKVCEKNAAKKRKPFDSLKQRVAGTDLADFHQPTYLKKKEEPVLETKPKQSKWKEKHMELVTAIRAAKGVPPSNKMPTSPTPKPRSTTSLIACTSQNERCPSCERHFGPKAFDRHVEWCKEKNSRIHQSPASVQQAKERLEARINYRAPLNKTKRTLVRDKYSSPQSPEPVPRNASSTINLTSSSLSRGPSIRKPKSLVNVEKTPETKEKSNNRRNGKSDGDKKRHTPEYDRSNMTLTFEATPVMGSPSPKAESVKSFQTKRPLPNPSKKQINTVDVNAGIQGLTVSSISNVDVNNKRMVTWKDTVATSDTPAVKVQSVKQSVVAKRKVATPQALRRVLPKSLNKEIDRIALKLQQMEPFSAVMAESKSEILPVDSKNKEVHKLVSSSDVLDRTKGSNTTIPTRKLRTVPTVLKKYKRPPDLDIINPPEEFAESTTTPSMNLNSHFDHQDEDSDSSYLNTRLKGVAELDNDDDSDTDFLLLAKEIDDITVVEGSGNIADWFDSSFAEEVEDGAENDSLEDPGLFCGADIGTRTPVKDDLEEFLQGSKEPAENVDDKTVDNGEDYIESISEDINVIDEDLTPIEQLTEISDQKNQVVCLYQSGTNLDLTRDNSRQTLTDKESFETLATQSNFSLKKSHSDIKIPSSTSFSLEPIFFRKKFPFESDSVDFRKTVQDIRSSNSSPPKVARFAFKSGEMGDKERQEILKMAAEKFIESTKKKLPLTGILMEEEDYSVPKKKRRIYCSESESSRNDEEAYVDEATAARPVILETEAQRSVHSSSPPGPKSASLVLPHSASSSVLSDSITPRTVTLVDKIVQGRQLKIDHSDVLLAISISECDRLLELDKRWVDKVAKKLLMVGAKRVKLPVIVGGRRCAARGDEVKEVARVKLPKIGADKEEVAVEDCGAKGGDLQSITNSNYDPFEVAQRQFLELLECDDFKPFTPSQTTTPTTPRANTTVPTPAKTPTTPLPLEKTVKSAPPVKQRNKRQSVIDPPGYFKDSLDSVTTTDSDDFELVESMIKNEEGGFYLHNLNNNDKNARALDQILADCRKYSDDMLMSGSIDPSLINENDNLSIPEHFHHIDDYSPTSMKNIDIDQYSAEFDTKIEPKATKKPLVKRSLSLINRSKRDTSLTRTNSNKVSGSGSNNNNVKKGLSNKTPTSKVSNNNKNSSDKSVSSDSKLREKKKKSLPLLKRSMTLLDPSPKPSFKNKKDVTDFFNDDGEHKMTASLTASVERTVLQSSQELSTPLDDMLKAEDLFSVDDEMYEEYKKYEEMYLKEKGESANSNRKSRSKPTDMNYGLLTNSEEEAEHSNNSNNKLSNDSAYGSLRKTSKQRTRAPKLTPLEPRSSVESSSSGSENGLNSPAPPPIVSSPTTTTTATAAGNSKVSKFCHECGTKFPVSSAKFCVECGAKRLVL